MDSNVKNKNEDSIARREENKNRFFIGTSGGGKGFHPWDNLFNCPSCNSRRVWMENENGTDSDVNQPVRIRCLVCGEKTKYGELLEVRSIWSNGKDAWGKDYYKNLFEFAKKENITIVNLPDDISSLVDKDDSYIIKHYGISCYSDKET